LHDKSSSASKPGAPTSEQKHDETVHLCTLFATYNAAMPKPQRNALDVLPIANGFRWALAENPNADPNVRQAIEELVRQYDGQMAQWGEVHTRGYAQPGDWKVEEAQAAFDRAWDACQLGN
jgi:hypothetical protein